MFHFSLFCFGTRRMYVCTSLFILRRAGGSPCLCCRRTVVAHSSHLTFLPWESRGGTRRSNVSSLVGIRLVAGEFLEHDRNKPQILLLSTAVSRYLVARCDVDLSRIVGALPLFAGALLIVIFKLQRIRVSIKKRSSWCQPSSAQSQETHNIKLVFSFLVLFVLLKLRKVGGES